jgi:hypothetical protein
MESLAIVVNALAILTLIGGPSGPVSNVARVEPGPGVTQGMVEIFEPPKIPQKTWSLRVFEAKRFTTGDYSIGAGITYAW